MCIPLPSIQPNWIQIHGDANKTGELFWCLQIIEIVAFWGEIINNNKFKGSNIFLEQNISLFVHNKSLSGALLTANQILINDANSFPVWIN